MGILPADTPLSCFSLTGYSGGGKKMIAQYEAEGREDLLSSPAIYGITQSHKHLPEMQVRCGLSCPPVFSPIVDDYYKGMATTVTPAPVSAAGCEQPPRRVEGPLRLLRRAEAGPRGP